MTYNFKIRDFYNDTFCQNEMFAKENENGNDYKMGELFRGFKFKSHYKPISAFSEKHLLQLLLLHISSAFGVEKKTYYCAYFLFKRMLLVLSTIFFFKRVRTFFHSSFSIHFFIDLKPNNRKNSPSSDEATILPSPQHHRGGLAASLKKRRPFHSLMAFNLSRESRNSVRQI